MNATHDEESTRMLNDLLETAVELEKLGFMQTSELAQMRAITLNPNAAPISQRKKHKAKSSQIEEDVCAFIKKE